MQFCWVQNTIISQSCAQGDAEPMKKTGKRTCCNDVKVGGITRRVTRLQTRTFRYYVVWYKGGVLYVDSKGTLMNI